MDSKSINSTSYDRSSKYITDILDIITIERPEIAHCHDFQLNNSTNATSCQVPIKLMV